MPKISVIVDDEMYMKIIKLKTKLQKDKPNVDIDFSSTVRHLLFRGITQEK